MGRGAIRRGVTPSRLATAAAALAAGGLVVAWLAWRLLSSFGDEAVLAILRESGARVEHRGDSGRLEVLLEGPDADDTALPAIAKLQRLESLALRGDGVTDASLEMLAPLAASRGLHSLTLQSTRVTAAGLRHLAALGIRALVLVQNDGLDPEEIPRISNLRRLDRLTLYDRRVTDADLARLARELAPCQVARRD